MKTSVERLMAREAMNHARKYGINDLGKIALHALVQALQPEGYVPPTPRTTSSFRANTEWHALRTLLQAGALSRNGNRFTAPKGKTS